MNGYDFSGQHVLVIGASRQGFVAAIARAFKSAGAKVAITGEEVAPAPKDQGQFAYHKPDVTDLAAMRGLAGGKAGFITGACIPVDGGYSIA